MRGNTYSKKQSSEQISRKLSEFIKEIQYKNRNPVDNNVLKILQEMETNPECNLRRPPVGDALTSGRSAL